MTDHQASSDRTHVVDRLCEMFAASYTRRSFFSSRSPDVTAMMNAIGACGGFAAQAAVWRVLIMPSGRNPGDFLVVIAKGDDAYFIGEAINQFIIGSEGRLSFLRLAASALSNVADVPDLIEMIRHVTQTLFQPSSFGKPRLPSGLSLTETSPAALAKTWRPAAQVLKDLPPAEWPVMLGMAAMRTIRSHASTVAPRNAIRLILEAAFIASRLDPGRVPQSGIVAPARDGWSMRAVRPENQQAIIAEVRAGMMPDNALPVQLVGEAVRIDRPTIGFADLTQGGSDPNLADDLMEIGALFGGNVITATKAMPRCDVLFLYGSVETSGRFAGQTLMLRQLIDQTGAKIVVVASEVTPQIFGGEFQKSLAKANHAPTNLIVTLARNGSAFSQFFKQLFQLMQSGVPIGMAYVRLAPQGPHQPANLPGTVCLVEVGNVSFGKGTTA